MLKRKQIIKLMSPWGMIRKGWVLLLLLAGFWCVPGGMASAAAPFSPVFSPEIGLIPYDQQAKQQDSPALRIDNSGNLYALWVDYRNGHTDIYFAYRPAGGQWGANVKVNDDTGWARQFNPAIALDESGNAFAVWQDERNDLQNLFFSVVSKPSSAWTAATNSRVNDDGLGASQRNPKIAVRGYELIYVWEDYRNGNWDIYSYAPPPLGTRPPNEIVNKDNGTEDQSSPSIALDGTGASAVWVDRPSGHDELCYGYHGAGGWVNSRVDIPVNAPRDPVLSATEAGDCYVLYEDSTNGNSEIFFTRRGVWDAGWAEYLKVNDDPPGMVIQKLPALAVDKAGNAQALWSDARTAAFPIGFRLQSIYSAYRPAGGIWGG